MTKRKQMFKRLGVFFAFFVAFVGLALSYLLISVVTENQATPILTKKPAISNKFNPQTSLRDETFSLKYCNTNDDLSDNVAMAINGSYDAFWDLTTALEFKAEPRANGVMSFYLNSNTWDLTIKGELSVSTTNAYVYNRFIYFELTWNDYQDTTQRTTYLHVSDLLYTSDIPPVYVFTFNGYPTYMKSNYAYTTSLSFPAYAFLDSRTYSAGYTGGYSAGHADGYEEGYNEGREYGYDEGHTNGYDEGYSEGHTEGYQEGYQTAQTESESAQTGVVTLFGAIAGVPITILNGFSDIAMLNVPIIQLLITLLFLAIALGLIKHFI